MSFTDFIIDFLFWGLTLICPAFIWSLWKKKDNMSWFLNQAYSHRKIKDDKLDVAAMLMYAIAGFLFIVPFAMASLPIVFNNTAIHAVLRFYLPNSWMENSIIGTIICSSYIAFLATLVVIQPIHLVESIMMVIVESENFLETSYIKGNAYKRIMLGSTSKVNVINAVNTYRVTFLIWRDFLSFGYAFFPTLMFTGYVVNVVTTFSLIKLHSELPITLVIMLALLDLTDAATTVGIHTFAMKILTEVNNFFYFWENEHKSPLGRRYIKSCLPIRVNIGPFFHLEPSTLLNTFVQVVDMTTTMLLA